MPLILTLCLGLLWWGRKERRLRWVVLAGVCAGILPYTYYPARLVPILFFAYGLSFLFPLRAGAWAKNPGRDSVGGGVCGGCGVGGGSASHLFRSAPRTLFHAHQ